MVDTSKLTSHSPGANWAEVIFRAEYVMDEAQIATLYRGQRYEDEADVPPSDGWPILRLPW